ncbi:type II toxin-antitoxin system VapC family toxin [Cellulomonas triticagri]|uniref:type II toxin-antitoxin system VapC family toxin n=1 Tax=Cellulomonas triticagri TaxID=2483352 RepID=UPI001315A5B2|nr:PIN domain-containing protein [Cellulomonas triticagri]
MIVVDANVVIAASTPDHVHHGRARDILVEHGSDGVVLHSLTMAEVLVGPARAGAQDAAHAAFEAAGLRSSPTTDPGPIALAVVRAQAALTMPDACVLATAEHVGVPLATFDARLAREAAARGTAVIGLTG